MPKISELPSGVPVSTGDSLPLVQSGTTKKATFNDLPISSAVQTALNLKADAANTNLTGTTNANNLVVSGTLSGAGVTKAAVGLGNVDNTSDVNKPVSTAQAVAIASVSSFRNKVRNPFMDIAQRGAGPFSIPGTSSAIYSLDGWVGYNSTSTGAFSIAQVQDVPTNAEYQNSLKATVTTAKASLAAGDLCSITQPIEGYMIRDLSGNPTVLRFDVKSSKAGTHCVALRNSTGAACYVMTYTVTAANTWQTIQLSIPGGLNLAFGTGWNTTSTVGLFLTFCFAAGTSFQGSANTWAGGNIHATSAQVNVMDTVGNVFQISGIQLERGSASTALEHKDINTECLLNYRYFYYGPLNLIGNAAGAGSYLGAHYRYPVPMRAAPAIVLGTPSENNNGSTPTVSPVYSDGFRVYLPSIIAGNVYYSNYYSASAEL